MSPTTELGREPHTVGFVGQVGTDSYKSVSGPASFVDFVASYLLQRLMYREKREGGRDMKSKAMAGNNSSGLPWVNG